MQLTQLIGVWKLLYINVTNPTASTTHYGPNTVGRIIITPELYFNAMITDYDQAALPKGITWNNATPAQRGVISKPMVVYEGMFSVQTLGNETYTHVAVENALDPEWVGSDQVRRASLVVTGGRSVLTLVPMNLTNAANPNSSQSLVWEKLDLPSVRLS